MPDASGQARVRVAVLLSGTGTNMAALLYASRREDCPYDIVLVTGDKPDAPGLALAQAEGLPVHRLPASLAKADLFAALEAALRDAGAEYVALAGFMRILPRGFVERWEGRILNIHPSLLPLYKGLDTHARALAAGDRKAGCSVHVVTPELDDGPVLGQTAVAILPDDTPATLAARVLIAEHQLYPYCLARYLSQPFDPNWLLGEVRRRALALPGAEERDSHGAPAWWVGGKSGRFFAHFSDQHHGTPHVAVLVRTTGEDEIASLIERAPDSYFRPAYYGASGWVGLILNRPGLDWEAVDEWLERSWRTVAPARLARASSLPR